MLMYSRKKVRYRRDGFCWKKRKDGKTTREDHMKLKVQGVEVSVQRQHAKIGLRIHCTQYTARAMKLSQYAPSINYGYT